MNSYKVEEVAQITAVLGFKTPVATMVAIEFPASFMPFKKSNANAMKIQIMTSVNIIC